MLQSLLLRVANNWLSKVTFFFRIFFNLSLVIMFWIGVFIKWNLFFYIDGLLFVEWLYSTLLSISIYCSSPQLLRLSKVIFFKSFTEKLSCMYFYSLWRGNFKWVTVNLNWLNQPLYFFSGIGFENWVLHYDAGLQYQRLVDRTTQSLKSALIFVDQTQAISEVDLYRVWFPLHLLAL